MKVLTNYEQLVGKTISFSHMAQFADQITLATTDGEVLMATFDEADVDEYEIRILSNYHVIAVVQRDSYLRQKLSELGIFDLEQWKKEREEQQRIEEEKRLKKQEELERKEYERLKAKFRNTSMLDSTQKET